MRKWSWFIRSAIALPLGEGKRFFQKCKHLIIQISIIIVVTFIFAEASFRVYNYFNPTFIFYDDSYNRYRAKPHSNEFPDFRFNSRGFKDKEFTEKKENVYRIIGIGDSFTFGVVPYKYNYLTRLGSQLKKDNYNIEILNMGIPGIGPREYLSLFVKEGLDLKPDMLLLTFYIGNDFYDCSRHKKLYEYSDVASFIKYLITLGTKYEGQVFSQGKYYDDKPGGTNETYFDILKDRSFVYLKGNEKFAKLDKIALHYLSLMNDICKEKHIKFIVVIAPDEMQIDKTVHDEFIRTYYPKLNVKNWDITQPNKVLMNELDKLGIKYIDLFPEFKESGVRLYVPRNTHWNIAGNQLAANIIEANLLKCMNHYIAKSR